MTLVITALTNAKSRCAKPGVWANNVNDAAKPERDCVISSIYRRASTKVALDAYELFIKANGISQHGLPDWNDTNTLEGVLAGFDKAILLALKEESGGDSER